MNRKKLWRVGLVALFLLISNVQIVLAHTPVTVGAYTVEIGWVNEPATVGQQNAIVVNVTTTSDRKPVEEVSALTVTISYGGQNKTLTLQPLGEDTPGQFVAPVLPTIPGQYTIILGGKIGDTVVDNVQVQPEEVQPADTLQFPVVASNETTNSAWNTWLVWLSLLFGLIGTGLGVMALRKASTR